MFTAKVREMLGRLPVYFVDNRGQFDRRVKYSAKFPGGTVYFTPGEIVYQFFRPGRKDAAFEGRPEAGIVEAAVQTLDRSFEPGAAVKHQKPEQETVRIQFVGANRTPQIEPQDESKAKFSYFRGNDPKMWVSGAPSFEKLIFRELYPKIDLVVSGSEGKLKNEYRVQPGGDPGLIALNYEGAESLTLNEKGQVEVKTEFGSLIEDFPISYQEIDGQRISVESRYVLDHEGTARLEVGAYQKDHDLIIDPLIYSTYIGSSGDDWAIDLKVDSSGNAYITGSTAFSDFPTTPGAYDATFNGGTQDAFVTKLSADGSSLMYSTYLGGNDIDYPIGVAVDDSGNAYLAGITRSPGFPVTAGAFDTSHNGNDDIFVTKLNPAGTALVFSTFLGGSLADWSSGGIVVDANVNVYISGMTASSNFPTTLYAYDKTLSGIFDIFVTKMNSTGSSLVYSTFLGGAGDDDCYGMALGGDGTVYLTGQVNSADFPTSPGAFDTSPNGSWDVIVSRISAGGTALVYSTYLGGSAFESAYSMAVDHRGNAYICGDTNSADFPTTPGAFDKTPDTAARDGFLSKLDPSGKYLIYSTFFGGSYGDYVRGLALNDGGYCVVSGGTSSNDFPTTPEAFDPTFNSGIAAFVTMFNSGGSSLLYSTYLGDSGLNFAYNMVLDSIENAYLTGETDSPDFPTTPAAYDQSYNGSKDVFVTKLPIDYRYQPPVRENEAAGDFNGNGQDEIAADFGSLGLWMWVGGFWIQLSGVDPDGMIAANVDGNTDDELAADFGPLGLWLWDSSAWSQASGVNPENMIAGNIDLDAAAEILADFGSLGLWLWNGGAWSNISDANPESMTAADVDGDGDAETVIDFGGVGLWLWNGGTWSKLANSNPDYAIAADIDGDAARELVCDFGSLGLWLYNDGDWTEQLSPLDAEGMIAGDLEDDGEDEVVADFADNGLQVWNAGAWYTFSMINPEDMVIANVDSDSNRELIVDFGATGLWLRESGAWTQLAGSNAEFLLAADTDGDTQDELSGDFGSPGMWLWDSGAWTQLSGANPDSK